MFQFKQFTIHQNHCAQKVSEVACIQGAWTMLPPGCKKVLDIGSGTGLLSLMLAQRFNDIQIDTIEIDDETYRQGKENMQASPFGQRIQCFKGDIKTFVFEGQYDFIITNPPFFEKQLKADNAKANTAKHSSQLTLIELINSIDKLLHQHGAFSVLFPYDRKDQLELICSDHHFYPTSYLLLRHSSIHLPKVFIAIFSRKKEGVKQEELIIKENGTYSAEMKALIEAFYL